ncbi:hypothetical protein EDB85DRAFT_1890601 [Lactarius pseudohatsudake]|nr:hypothetical protein EDB85DRAFT_1890601 [Lactarius pseudohatsudake]
MPSKSSSSCINSQRKKKKTRKVESAGEEGVRQLKRKGKGKRKEVVIDIDEGAKTEPEVVNNSEEDGDKVEDLDVYQGQGIPEIVIAKKDSTQDLLTVFSDKIKVIFKKSMGVTETLEGQWCMICRAEVKKVLKEKRQTKRMLRQCFLLGSNLTCHGHIAGHHFKEYEMRCGAAIPKIILNFCCVPPEAKKEKGDIKKQSVLTFPKESRPTEFSRVGLLEAVTKHLVCDDQRYQDRPHCHRPPPSLHHYGLPTVCHIITTLVVLVIAAVKTIIAAVTAIVVAVIAVIVAIVVAIVVVESLGVVRCLTIAPAAGVIAIVGGATAITSGTCIGPAVGGSFGWGWRSLVTVTQCPMCSPKLHVLPTTTATRALPSTTARQSQQQQQQQQQQGDCQHDKLDGHQPPPPRPFHRQQQDSIIGNNNNNDSEGEDDDSDTNNNSKTILTMTMRHNDSDATATRSSMMTGIILMRSC